MSMTFISIKKGIVSTLLANATAGQYQVLGYQKNHHDAEKISEYNRVVTVYFNAGTFAPGSRPQAGVAQHDMTFEIRLLVAANAPVDLSVIDDPNATPGEIATASAAYRDAGQHADDLMDDFWSRIWNILADPVNKNFGLADGIIAQVPGAFPLGDFQKSDMGREGAQAILAGTAVLKLRCTETPAGETGVPLVGIESHVAISTDIENETIDPDQPALNVDTEGLGG